MLFCWYFILVGLFLLSEIGFNLNLKVERVWWEDRLSCGLFFLQYLIFWVIACAYSLPKKTGEENLHKEIRTDSSVKKCLEGLDTPEMCRPLCDCTESSSSCFILLLGIGFLFVLCWHLLPALGRKMTSNQADLLIYLKREFVLSFCTGCTAFRSCKDLTELTKRKCRLST